MAKRIGFLGTKGGVGTTTVAVHFAEAWASRGAPVVLVTDDARGHGLRLLVEARDTPLATEYVIHPAEGLSAAVEAAGHEQVVVDLGTSPATFDLDLVVLVSNGLPESLAHAHGLAKSLPEGILVALLINAPVAGCDATAVLRRLVGTCAAFGSHRVVPLGVVPHSRAVSKWATRSKTAQELGAWLPAAKVIAKLTDELIALSCEAVEAPTVDLHGLVADRAA